MTRRGLLRSAVRLGMAGALASLSSGAYASQVEPDWVEIERLDLVLPRLPREFDGFRLCQISDIHIEGGDMARRFPGVCQLAGAQGADALVMTGDYTAYGGDWQGEALYQGFQHLSAPSGVFATMGNHDHTRVGAGPGANVGLEMVRDAFERTGVQELPNRAVAFQRGGKRLWMAGLDDAMTGHADFNALCRQIPNGEAAVLLHHEPDYADEWAPSGRFDLMLSGHSHGGQIAMPFVGPLGFRLPPHCRKYPRGHYRVGAMHLYTNRGLGTIAVPLRFCARPEITIFTLKCAA